MNNTDKTAGMWPDDDDWVAYMPMEEIRAFERIYENMEKVRDILKQVHSNAIQVKELTGSSNVPRRK